MQQIRSSSRLRKRALQSDSLLGLDSATASKKAKTSSSVVYNGKDEKKKEKEKSKSSKSKTKSKKKSKKQPKSDPVLNPLCEVDGCYDEAEEHFDDLHCCKKCAGIRKHLENELSKYKKPKQDVDLYGMDSKHNLALITTCEVDGCKNESFDIVGKLLMCVDCKAEHNRQQKALTKNEVSSTHANCDNKECQTPHQVHLLQLFKGESLCPKCYERETLFKSKDGKTILCEALTCAKDSKVICSQVHFCSYEHYQDMMDIFGSTRKCDKCKQFKIAIGCTCPFVYHCWDCCIEANSRARLFLQWAANNKAKKELDHKNEIEVQNSEKVSTLGDRAPSDSQLVLDKGSSAQVGSVFSNPQLAIDSEMEHEKMDEVDQNNIPTPPAPRRTISSEGPKKTRSFLVRLLKAITPFGE